MEIVGHRGARGEAPENTLAGFRHALEVGVREIELDVRLSADGHLIVVHDPELDRTTWHSGPVHQRTLAELGLMDARRNTPGWHAPLGIPALTDVLDFCPEHVRFQLEVKTLQKAWRSRLAHELAPLFEKRRLHQRATVTSPDTGLLKTMRALDDRIRLGLLTQSRFDQSLRRAGRLDCSWLVAHRNLVNKRLVNGVHKRNMKISVWTVNSVRDARQLRELGVDSLITDYPARMINQLGPDGGSAHETYASDRNSRISEERDMASR